MLAKKSISIGSLGSALDSMPGILKSEDIGLINSYETFLLKKMNDADSIIEKAHEDAKSIAKTAKEQAEVEFWKQTNNSYMEIHHIRQALLTEIENQCSQLMIECLQKLTDEIPSIDRIKPLIRSVLEKHNSDEPAKILVNAEQIHLLTDAIRLMPVQVIPDASLDKDTVILKTEKSQYEASFKGKLSLLIKSLK